MFYVLFLHCSDGCTYSCNEFKGLFSTEDKAWEAAMDLLLKNKEDYSSFTLDDFTVRPEQVDQP